MQLGCVVVLHGLTAPARLPLPPPPTPSPSRDAGGGPDAGANSQFFLQFITRYMHHQKGETRCRVTTVTRRWIDGTQIGEVITGEPET